MVDFYKHLKKNKMSNRAALKATPLKKLKKKIEEDDAIVGVSANEFLNLEDGKTTKIRLFPAHPDEETFYAPHVCYWLSVQRNDGEMGRTTVNDSIVHGRTKKDICREYISFAKKKFSNDDEKMDVITDFKKGLAPSYTWIAYAKQCNDESSSDIKIWEFKKMVRDAINKLTFNEDDGEAIEVDPFTDPDDGLPLFVKYISKPNKKKGENYYEVTLGKKPKAMPLTDEEVDKFLTLKPISEYYPKYGIKDFDRALEGLQNWDEENEFGLFEDDDFLSIVEEVRAQYSNDDDEDEKPKKKKVTKKPVKKVEEPEDDDDDSSEEDEEEEKPAKKSKAKAKKQPEPEEDEEDEEEAEDEDDESEGGDQFDDMDRSELKAYIKENDLDVSVKKSMSDDDLRDAIRAAEGTEEEPEDEDDEEEEDEEDEKPKKKGGISLSEIRKKLAKK